MKKNHIFKYLKKFMQNFTVLYNYKYIKSPLYTVNISNLTIIYANLT